MVVKGLKVERTGSCFLMGIELQFCTMEGFWSSGDWLYNSMNIQKYTVKNGNDDPLKIKATDLHNYDGWPLGSLRPR